MTNEVLARAYRAIGQGYYEAADALLEAASAPSALAPVLTRPVAVSADPEFPSFAPDDYEALPLAADTPGLGRCPTHGIAWTVKAAGVSKAGKAYNSFWKCDGKTDGVFCNKKPVKSWADTHPL